MIPSRFLVIRLSPYLYLRLLSLPLREVVDHVHVAHGGDTTKLSGSIVYTF